MQDFLSTCAPCLKTVKDIRERYFHGHTSDIKECAIYAFMIVEGVNSYNFILGKEGSLIIDGTEYEPCEDAIYFTSNGAFSISNQGEINEAWHRDERCKLDGYVVDFKSDTFLIALIEDAKSYLAKELHRIKIIISCNDDGRTKTTFLDHEQKKMFTITDKILCLRGHLSLETGKFDIVLQEDNITVRLVDSDDGN